MKLQKEFLMGKYLTGWWRLYWRSYSRTFINIIILGLPKMCHVYRSIFLEFFLKPWELNSTHYVERVKEQETKMSKRIITHIIIKEAVELLINSVEAQYAKANTTLLLLLHFIMKSVNTTKFSALTKHDLNNFTSQ